MDVLGRDVFEIDIVDLRADLNVFRHLRRRDKITHRARRVSRQFVGIAALFKKIAACFAPPFCKNKLQMRSLFCAVESNAVLMV